MNLYSCILRREHGFRPRMGEEDFIHKCIYNSFQPYEVWGNGKDNVDDYGGIFNLEFSPDGGILVAACEKKAVLLFDPITTKITKTVQNAHNDNVNCVRFLDNRIFATCSDDTTVALWDTRNLKQKIRSLQGHSNWVKNIEYSLKDRLLVTSGFDGSVYTWDVNSYTEQGFVYQKVFHTSGLMRCRISPDASKLVICTTGGYLIIIHDLDLTTLAKDLSGFRPNIYRLMQLGRQLIPQAAKFDHVFSKSQKKNRVELISDFPENNDAEVVSALQIHPQGWCALSRNISYDEGSEWTCVHDIQEDDTKKEERESKELNDGKTQGCDAEDSNINANENENQRPDSNFQSTSSENGSSSRNSNSSNRSEHFVPDIWAAEITVQDRACRVHRGRNPSSHTFAYVYAISSGVLTPNRRRCEVERSNNEQNDDGSESETSMADYSRSVYMPFYNRQINQNLRRLLYYIPEQNRGKGFIKEPSFSSDGRIICSPYGFGVRLLGFANECSELPEAVRFTKKLPQPLKNIKVIQDCHTDVVVSTKFSPRHPLLVTGCLRGNVVWHHPDF